MMSFAVEQIFESSDGRTAVVMAVRSSGREGLLLFTDSGHEQWFPWNQLHQSRKWKQKVVGGDA
jgi:hypothetical protein